MIKLLAGIAWFVLCAVFFKGGVDALSAARDKTEQPGERTSGTILGVVYCGMSLAGFAILLIAMFLN